MYKNDSFKAVLGADVKRTHLLLVFGITLDLFAVKGLLGVLHLRLRDHRPTLRKRKKENE